MAQGYPKRRRVGPKEADEAKPGNPYASAP